jgi:hypothetical protein
MGSENGIPARHHYAGTGETRAENTDRDHARNALPDREQPTMLVELVIVEGPEGQQLHAIQAEVIQRILTRVAEQRAQALQKESRL